MGFFRGFVGDVFVLVEGVLSLFDFSVEGGDFGSFSAGLCGVLGSAGESDHGWFDLVNVGCSAGDSVGLVVEVFDGLVVFHFPSFYAWLVLVFGWVGAGGSG